MQRIEMYHDLIEARADMEQYLENGWRIHTCTMSCYVTEYSFREKLLVIYEK